MQPRASAGDGFRVSVASAHSILVGGSDPDDTEPTGDVYTWGEIFADAVSPDGNSGSTQVPSKTDVLIPKFLESNFVLDAHQISSGVNHIAVVTKQGEIFTWGEVFGGRLGHRADKDSGRPHLVEFLEVPSLAFVACGEYHTCALSNSSECFTWGEDTRNAGLLGHGTDTSHWIPKKIEGPLEGLQVVSVSCGAWHSALATSNGKLFTFGDGAFGVLGHGDQESVMYPKEVQMLGGLKAIKVACGVWHTAAIIEVMFHSGSKPWKLFTWGDGEKYRLGHGNKETYLQPTRVSSLIEYNFHQVACGHTMTVALTTSGHVFTMGGTEYGQLGNPASAGKVPTLVQDKLLGEFVEEISCGANHVAALTSKNEVYTWGRGANGRLGHGDTEDKNSPTLVAALKDRNVKSISCGSNFTSCICILKMVPGSDQPFCSGCRQAFGITRKKHNCYNCGLAFCHPCSSRKVVNAALAVQPEKPHRVCDNCYAKLVKVVEASGSASHFSRKATPSHTAGREVPGQGEASSSRTLFSPITKSIKYLEIKNSNSGRKHDSTSIVRASQVPSRQQLKDIAFPSSLSSIHYVLKPTIPPSAPQILPANSMSTPPITTRPIPSRSVSPRLSGGLIDSLRRTTERLNQEVSKLQNEIQSLKMESDMQVAENQKLQRKATEAIALAAVESSHLSVAIEFIESTKDQLKELTEKFSQDIPDSKVLRIIHTRAEDVLKEISESETFSSSSKLRSEKINAPRILSSDRDNSKLQEDRLEENIGAAQVDPLQANGNSLQENNRSKLESEKQNALDIHAAQIVPSKPHDQTLKENVDATQAVSLQADENFPQESNRSMLESEQQNAPASHSDSSTLHEHRLEENVDDAAQVDPLQAVENVLQESDGSESESEQQIAPDVHASHEHKLEGNADVATQVAPSQAIENFLQESDGSNFESQKQNAPNEPASHSDPSTLHEHRLEENADAAAQVDLLQDVGSSFQEINGTKPESEEQKAASIHSSQSVPTKLHEHGLEETKGKSVSTNGASLPPQQSVEYGSRSLDSSRSGRQGEEQIIEQFEPGVFVTLILRPDGVKVFKHVRFSKRKFSKSQAEEWWLQNKLRVLRQYYSSLPKIISDISNTSPHAEHSEAASSSSSSKN